MQRLAPKIRGICAVLIVAGAGLCTDGLWLLLAWAALTLVAVSVGLGRLQVRLTLAFVLPFALGSLLINGLLQPRTPGDPWWADFGAAAPTTWVIVCRLAVVAVAAQLCFVPLLHGGRLIGFLRSWGCSHRVVLISLGGVTLLGELGLRTRQVLDARRAQGIGSMSGFSGLRQLPLVVLPLTIYMLDAAANRAELWRRRDLVDSLARYQPRSVDPSSVFADTACLAVSIAWFAAALFSRWTS